DSRGCGCRHNNRGRADHEGLLYLRGGVVVRVAGLVGVHHTVTGSGEVESASVDAGDVADASSAGGIDAEDDGVTRGSTACAQGSRSADHSGAGGGENNRLVALAHRD